MAKIKKIEVFSFVRFHALLFALLGFLAGFLYSVGGFVIDLLVSMGWITSVSTPGLSYGTVLAFGALVGMPIIFAVVGIVTGFIGAIMYNVFAKWFGGIGLEFEE
jgi:energy-coupling factor transporter transmembrane protein EcfT